MNDQVPEPKESFSRENRNIKRWAKQWYLKRCNGRRIGICIVDSGIQYYFYDENDPELIQSIMKMSLESP